MYCVPSNVVQVIVVLVFVLRGSINASHSSSIKTFLLISKNGIVRHGAHSMNNYQHSKTLPAFPSPAGNILDSLFPNASQFLEGTQVVADRVTKLL